MAASLHGLPCSLLPPPPHRGSQCRPPALIPSAASSSLHYIPARQASRQHARWHQTCPSSSPCLTQASKSGGQEVIQGYTPANYISYSDRQEHACRHMIRVNVQAPVSVCFDLWNDWVRLVDFLDLISQIGLDPDEPDMALFQCFYRWGRMPVMEIVFLARKSHVEEDKRIQFETVWGLPAQGEVEFIEDGPNSTTVLFRFEHQMPVLLVELKVGVLNMQTHLKGIFAENMEDFKQLAEMLAQEPGNAPPRRTAETRKASGASGAPQAMPPSDEQRPWAHKAQHEQQVQHEQQAQHEQQVQQQAQQQAQHEQQVSSSSNSEEGSAHQAQGAGSSRRGRASPTPSPSSQQPQEQQQYPSTQERNGEEGSRRRGRPRSRRPSATPPSLQGSSEQAQGGGVSEAGGLEGSSTKGGSEEGLGESINGAGGVRRRSKKTPARSSSPSAAAGQPIDSPPPASSKNKRKSRSATNSQ